MCKDHCSLLEELKCKAAKEVEKIKNGGKCGSLAHASSLEKARFRNKVNSRYTRLRRGLYQKFLESEISQMEKDRQDMTDNLNFSVFSAIEREEPKLKVFYSFFQYVNHPGPSNDNYLRTLVLDSCSLSFPSILNLSDMFLLPGSTLDEIVHQDNMSMFYGIEGIQYFRHLMHFQMSEKPVFDSINSNVYRLSVIISEKSQSCLQVIGDFLMCRCEIWMHPLSSDYHSLRKYCHDSSDMEINHVAVESLFSQWSAVEKDCVRLQEGLMKCKFGCDERNIRIEALEFYLDRSLF